MTGPVTPDHPRRLLWGLVIALAAWGIYLAIGATGVFTDVGLFDARRSAIVLACSATFIGFWVWILLHRHDPQAEITTSSSNRPSVISFLCVAAAYILWAGAWIAWNAGNPANLSQICGWISVGFFGLAALLALVGLSDPRRERHKLWGLLTLLLLLTAGVGLVAQVRHFVRL